MWHLLMGGPAMNVNKDVSSTLKSEGKHLKPAVDAVMALQAMESGAKAKRQAKKEDKKLARESRASSMIFDRESHTEVSWRAVASLATSSRGIQALASTNVH